MDENIYRKARKNAARNQPLLNNCESAQDLVYIERTKLLGIESGDKVPSPDDVVSMSKAANTLINSAFLFLRWRFSRGTRP